MFTLHTTCFTALIFIILFSLCAAIGFNVETVTYKNLKFQVWDLGGQTSIRYAFMACVTDMCVLYVNKSQKLNWCELIALDPICCIEFHLKVSVKPCHTESGFSGFCYRLSLKSEILTIWFPSVNIYTIALI